MGSKIIARDVSNSLAHPRLIVHYIYVLTETFAATRTYSANLVTVLSVTDFALAVNPRSSLHEWSRGCYPGTTIPLKVIPENATITVIGNRASDDHGGWIVDRFLGDRGTLGARQSRRVHGC